MPLTWIFVVRANPVDCYNDEDDWNCKAERHEGECHLRVRTSLGATGTTDHPAILIVVAHVLYVQLVGIHADYRHRILPSRRNQPYRQMLPSDIRLLLTQS